MENCSGGGCDHWRGGFTNRRQQYQNYVDTDKEEQKQITEKYGK
jgi:hypothetical protein